jgi:hypothetical protein
MMMTLPLAAASTVERDHPRVGVRAVVATKTVTSTTNPASAAPSRVR